MSIERGLLGNAIRQARINANISQEELAEKINISSTHLKHIESEHRKPSLDVLFEIAQTLSLSLDSLLFPPSSPKETITKNICLLLDKCTEQELNITLELISSLLRNRP